MTPGHAQFRQQFARKRLLYLYMARVHPLYLERHQRQRNVKGLDVEALKYYLKASPAWEGFKKAKKFQGAAKACLVFDVEKLPFELEDTVAALSRRRRHGPEDDAPATAVARITKIEKPVDPPTEDPQTDELPF